ncbi:hypothetical protein F0562_017392 [Nyssa sinensis]|uniref:Uncharacterized protein n=1 Tax=Nyssa sinensis TaxID=561372 RepID=A0A5J4ZGH4_9ASTE|nr:hypothetical protein F0562_017392 [Nyssa sinensis]
MALMTETEPVDVAMELAKRKKIYLGFLYRERTEMGKYVEMLDLGVRIAARFHSHCPQTARMYYRPPSNSGDDHQQNHHDAHNGGSGNHAPLHDSTQMASFSVKASMAFDTTDLILCSLM